MILRFDKYRKLTESQLSMWDDYTPPSKEEPAEPTKEPKVLQKAQLNLWDRAFSSQTIVHTLLNVYKSAPVVLENDVKTVADAVRFIENRSNIEDAVRATLQQDGLEDHYDTTLDRDDVANAIIGMSKDEFQWFIIQFAESGPNTETGSYDEFFPEYGEALQGEAFDEVYNPALMRDWAYDFADALIDNEYDKGETLVELLGEKPLERMLTELVCNNHEDHLTSSHHDELTSHMRELLYDKNTTTMTIHRAITLPYSVLKLDAATKERSGLGIYWSYSENGAEAHWGEGYDDGFHVKLTAEVDIQNVDWSATLFKSLYGLSSELEVEVRENATVTITQFYTPNMSYEATLKLIEYYTSLGLDMDTLNKIRSQMNGVVKLASHIVAKV